ncbi:MAG: divergent polysaccharide deacetylase family protein, partial [Pseudomonadales bacterium]
MLAIVVDDVGYNLAQAERLLKAPGKLTLGILPFAPHSPAIARRAQIAGKEVILHQPMEPIATPYSHSERGTLTMQMSAEHFNQHFADALA